MTAGERFPGAGPRVWIVEHDPLPVVGRPAWGHAVDSDYAETYWLPILGPSAMWALRRLVARVDGPSGAWVPLGPFAAELGLGKAIGRSSALVACLDRLVHFRFAAIYHEAYHVSMAVPDLGPQRLERLPEHLQERHDQASTTTKGALT